MFTNQLLLRSQSPGRMIDEQNGTRISWSAVRGSPMQRSFQALSFLFFLTACVIPLNQPQPAPNSTPPSNSQPSIGPASCSISQDWCQGSCVESSTFLNDSSNCGRCGNHCAFDETCTGGTCSCSPGSEKCMGQCRSFASYIGDSQNCGRCGNICFGGEQCIGGSCRKM